MTPTVTDGYVLDLTSRWGMPGDLLLTFSPLVSDTLILPILYFCHHRAHAPPSACSDFFFPNRNRTFNSRQSSKLIPGVQEILIIYANAEEAQEALRHLDGGILFGCPL
jgi:hypothetical protein